MTYANKKEKKIESEMASRITNDVNRHKIPHQWTKHPLTAQKDLADGKKTLKSYYWYICGQEYDQEHGNG